MTHKDTNFKTETHIWNESNSREKLIKKMIKAYNKNKSKIKGAREQPEPSQSEKRARKLADLTSRSDSWRNLQ